jgi:hypothetical protein
MKNAYTLLKMDTNDLDTRQIVTSCLLSRSAVLKMVVDRPET